MLRKVLKAKIHRATVTRSDLHYEGSISIDQALMEAAELLPYEAVHEQQAEFAPYNPAMVREPLLVDLKSKRFSCRGLG